MCLVLALVSGRPAAPAEDAADAVPISGQDGGPLGGRDLRCPAADAAATVAQHGGSSSGQLPAARSAPKCRPWSPLPHGIAVQPLGSPAPECRTAEPECTGQPIPHDALRHVLFPATRSLLCPGSRFYAEVNQNQNIAYR